MKEENIVFKGRSSKGTSVIIRYPTRDDAKFMCRYINTLSKEKTFVRFQGEEVSLKQETKYLNSQLEKMGKHEVMLLLAFSDNQLIGVSEVDMRDKIDSHVGVFGISIAKNFRAQGIGTLLLKMVLHQARKQLPQL